MTTPDFGFYMRAYTLVGGDRSSANSRVTTGVSGGSTSIGLPLGDNMLRITALGAPETKVQIIVVQGSKNTVLNTWREVGLGGLVLQAPNDVEGAWFALRSDTPGVSLGLTLFNTPPAT